MNGRRMIKAERSVLALAVASTLTVAPVQANESNSPLIEEIIVTASKRQTTLQETPIAVSVTSQETIEQAQVLDITDLQTLVPSLRVTPLQNSGNTNFAIRGFGNGTNNIGIEPSVGVFIDGVYRSRAAAQIGDLPRLQRVEVLRGPQSTLFGKNASAGVISVVTEAPSYDPTGKIKLGIGNYNQRVLKGHYSAGISDTLAFSVSGGINQRDGYSESLTDVPDNNDRDRWNLRSQVLFEPTESTRFRLIMDYSEIDEICCTVANFRNGPSANAIRALGAQILDPEDMFSYTSYLNYATSNKIDDGGISLQADIDFDGFTLTSISAYRSNAVKGFGDNDYTSLDIITGAGDLTIDTATQEFRLTSNNGGNLDWMVGAYFFTEEIENRGTLFFGDDLRAYFDALLSGIPIPGGFLAAVEGLTGFEPGAAFFAAGTEVTTLFDQENDAYSLFATFDYHFSDALTATVGISYTNDEKDIKIDQIINEDVLSAFDVNTVAGGILPQTPLAPLLSTLQAFQFVPPFVNFPNAVEDGSSSDSKTTWTARLSYQLNDNMNVYVSAATGFKASSWNLSRDSRPFIMDQAALESAGLTQVNQTYGTRFAEPEEATVYEIGLKAQYDNSAFNITVFEQTIEGFQSSIFLGTGFVLSNAGEQSTKGVEFDALWAPTESWNFTIAGTFLDPIYDEFRNAQGPNGPTDLTGTTPSGIHETSISAGATYNMEFDNGAYGYIRADYLYESEADIAANIEGLTREVGTWNASAGLTFNNGVTAQLWIRNLNNDEYFLSGFPGVVQSGTINVYPNQPRTYGASVSYEF